MLANPARAHCTVKDSVSLFDEVLTELSAYARMREEYTGYVGIPQAEDRRRQYVAPTSDLRRPVIPLPGAQHSPMPTAPPVAPPVPQATSVPPPSVPAPPPAPTFTPVSQAAMPPSPEHAPVAAPPPPPLPPIDQPSPGAPPVVAYEPGVPFGAQGMPTLPLANFDGHAGAA